jgi:hypothetical protein
MVVHFTGFRQSQGHSASAGSFGSPSFVSHQRAQIRAALDGPVLQTKLALGAPGDAFEIEADRVADQVTRGALSQRPAHEAGNNIQRTSQNGDDELLQQSPAADSDIKEKNPFPEEAEQEGVTVQAKASSAGPAPLPDCVERGIAAIRGHGSPLDAESRTSFEPRFGCDFSAIRVHTDPEAAGLASGLGARAFTVGSDVVFGRGEYQPGTPRGQHLLAHELTHTLQQSKAKASPSVIQTYRSADAPNFRAMDGGGLVEKPFDKRKPDPYINHIKVHFTRTVKIDGETVPAGTLSATYAKHRHAPISNVPIVGGFPSTGLTDRGDNMHVSRIEGWGYHHAPGEISTAERLVPTRTQAIKYRGPIAHYYKPRSRGAGDATMSFGLFFSGKEAIHHGRGTNASIGCVHVPNLDIMRQLNYHSRAGIVTQVEVKYDEAIRTTICHEAAKFRRMPWNPCHGVKP